MSIVRPYALTERSLATQRLYFLTSTLLAFVLVLGVDLSTLTVFGVKVTFSKPQLLLVLLVGNTYFNLAYTIHSWRDLREQERVFDIATHDEFVGKPAYDRLEQAIEDISKSTALPSSEKLALIDGFSEAARAMARPLSQEHTTAEMERFFERCGKAMEALIAAIGTSVRQTDPVLAGRLNVHIERMQRRREIYIDVREEGLRHAEGATSLSYLLPVVAGFALNALVVFALAVPTSYATFERWLTEIDATYFDPREPPQGSQ